jgi:hypothetical protein
LEGRARERAALGIPLDFPFYASHRTPRKGAQWTCFNDVHADIPDADFVNGLLVFNIRQNRFRLIVLPGVFTPDALRQGAAFSQSV